MTREQDPVERLRLAAPIAERDIAGSGVDVAARELRDEIAEYAVAHPASVSIFRSKRRPRLALVAACLVVAMAGTAGAAYWLTARTGKRVEGRTPNEQVIGAEIIRLDAPDLDEVVAGMADDYPLPDSMGLAYITERISTDEPTEMDEVGVESMIAAVVYCGWAQEWLDARRSGDERAAAAAGGVLVEAAGWDVFEVVDADGAYVESFREQAEAVKRGDEAPIREDVAVNC